MKHIIDQAVYGDQADLLLGEFVQVLDIKVFLELGLDEEARVYEFV